MRDQLLFQGGAVKALGPYRFGGYGIIFSSELDPDLENEFFTGESEFWLEDRVALPVLYSHALDPSVGKTRLATATFRKDAGGVWFEGQMEVRNEYVEKIMELIKKTGWVTRRRPWAI